MTIQVIVLLEVRDPERFHEFETRAIQIMGQHSGRIVSAFRPDPNLSTDGDVHEVHVIEFESKDAFLAYRSDPRLAELASLRKAAILSTEMYVAGESVTYESE